MNLVECVEVLLASCEYQHYIGGKTQAMQINESETHAFPHMRSSEFLRVAAQRQGSMVSLKRVKAHELACGKRVGGSDL